MAFTPKLTYKASPSSARTMKLYYGNMTDHMCSICRSRPPTCGRPAGCRQGPPDAALYRHHQGSARSAVMRQTTKIGLYNALDIGSIWLQKANAQ